VNRRTAYLVIVCALVLAAGCGGDKEREDPRAGGPTVDSAHVSMSVPQLPRLTGGQLDSLRAKKKRFNITQDQYWQNEGGVLANQYFEVWYPAGAATVTHGMYVFEELMPARRTFEEFFGQAPGELLVIRLPADLDAYKASTGLEWWRYSEIKGDSLTFAPVYILYKRGISYLAVPHEYYQWAVQKITRGGAPRWLEEGIASYLCGEGDLVLNQLREFSESDLSMTPEKIEEVLQGEEDRRESRIAYYHSFRMVEELIKRYGEEKFKEAVVLIGMGNTLDQAFVKAVQKDYRSVLEDATQYSVEIPTKTSS
jgi:hypothetical protein